MLFQSKISKNRLSSYLRIEVERNTQQNGNNELIYCWKIFILDSEEVKAGLFDEVTMILDGEEDLINMLIVSNKQNKVPW